MQKSTSSLQASRIPGARRWAALRGLAGMVLVLAIVLGAPPVVSSQSNGFKIIVHKANPATSLSTREISSLFLKKTTQWDDKTTVLPVDLVVDSPVRKEFTDVVHRRKVPAVKNYWAQSIFAGRADPPPELANDVAVVAHVAGNPGAVGYVSASADTGSVKVLKITD